MIHTREIIKHIDYDKLVEKNIIPDLNKYLSVESKQQCKYPFWVYKYKCYITFGIYMDYIVRKAISEIATVNFGIDPLISDNYKLDAKKIISDFESPNTKWNNIAYPLYCLLFENKGYKILDKKEFQHMYGFLESICKKIKKEYQRYCKHGTKFNAEFKSGKIFGHPDIITDNLILDIKTSCNFNKMSKESFLQILTYLALARDTNKNYNSVGILLSLHKHIVGFDLRNWNLDKFLNILHQISLSKNIYPQTISLQTISLQNDSPQNGSLQNGSLQTLSLQNGSLNLGDFVKYVMQVGYTRNKGKLCKSLYKHYMTSIAKYNRCLPCQMFLTSRNGRCATKEEFYQASKIIEENSLQYFTHSPYTINLCDPYTSKDKTSDEWVLNLFLLNLEMTKLMKGKGVVVHVGKSKKNTNN